MMLSPFHPAASCRPNGDSHPITLMPRVEQSPRREIQLSETVYHVPPETDVRALRERLGLSQSDFAALFGFNVRSLQDWEQGRRRPEIPIRAYLAVIQRDPEAVIRALRAA
jgi:putative transcriptional regulator